MAEEFNGPRPGAEYQQTRPIVPEQQKSNRVVEWLRSLLPRKNKTTHREVQEPQTPRPTPRQTEQFPMPRHGESTPKFDNTDAREKAFLAEQETEGLKVLPGDTWAMHYPNGSDERGAAVERLFNGTSEPTAEVGNVTPDALIYDQKDIKIRGKDVVKRQINRIVTTHENYDFPRFTAFVAEMHGTSMTPEMADAYYGMIASDKSKRVMLETYEHTDKMHVLESLKDEAAKRAEHVATMQPMMKIMAAARTNAFNDQGVDAYADQRKIDESLHDREKDVYETIKDAYKKYIEHGDEQAYRTVVETIKSFHNGIEDQEAEVIPTPPADEELSEPPPASDEYDPPKEKEQTNRRFYEVTPAGENTEAQLGYYAKRKDSDFDANTKMWSTATHMQPWTQAIQGEDRQAISGIAGKDLIEIPIPAGYALDVSSLRLPGNATISRDQNGCFYIRNSERGTFSIDFVKEEPPFQRDASFSDSQTIHKGLLTQGAEALIAELKNTNALTMDRAQSILNFIHERHIYPKDLTEAAQVQDAIKARSTADNYIQNLELSQKLECLSSNTLFVAMLRHAGVQSRIVTGHNITEPTDGKAVMDESTSHAWSEVWDGTKWVTMDATPPQEQSSDEQGEDGEKKEGQEGKDGQEGTPKSDEDGLPKEAVTDAEKQEAEQNLEASKEAVDQAIQQQEQMNDKMQNAESFKDFEDLKKEIEENPDLFDDMKEALEDMIEAKEEKKKNEIKDELEKMREEGFLDEAQEERLKEMMDNAEGKALDDLKKRIENESAAYIEFDKLREEVSPLVDEWYGYFVERLPKEDVIEIDEDNIGRRGTIDKNALKRPSSQLFGKAFHPRVFKPEIRPKFLASIAVDVSLSMEEPSAGNPTSTKLHDAKKLVVFYNELFSRISKEYGYIRYSMYSFAQGVNVIKRFDQEYDSSQRYDFPDSQQATIKKRLIDKMSAGPYSNMFDALRTAGNDLNEEIQDFPDYASSLYFIGDGDDNVWNPAYSRDFLQKSEEQGGFGDHNKHAIMLGDERQKQILAKTFGDENTTVAPDFDTLIEQAMYKFDDDMEDYFAGKI